MRSAIPTRNWSDIAMKYEELDEPDPRDTEGDEEENLSPVHAERRAGEEEQEEEEAEAAPVERICVSSSDESPEPRTTFETVPFTAKRLAATMTIVYPSRVRSSTRPSSEGRKGASTIRRRLFNPDRAPRL